MFEKAKDAQAAEGEILQLFKDTDKKNRANIVHIFKKGFIKTYNKEKKVCLRSNGNTLYNDMNTNLSTVIKILSVVKGREKEYEADRLGMALGIFLATVEYGIANPRNSANCAGIYPD